MTMIEREGKRKNYVGVDEYLGVRRSVADFNNVMLLKVDALWRVVWSNFCSERVLQCIFWQSVVFAVMSE